MDNNQPVSREEFEELKRVVNVNTLITADIHKILVDARVVRRAVTVVLKWITLISGAVSSVIALYHTYFK